MYTLDLRASDTGSVDQPSSDMVLPIPPSTELALTEQYPPTKFSTLKYLKKTVASEYNKLSKGDENHQYLSLMVVRVLK
jgi:hypothetical protein